LFPTTHGPTASRVRCAFGSGTGELSSMTGSIWSALVMAAGSRVMVSYSMDREHGGVGLDKEREQKEDGRCIIFYTFEDEED
jgi:hypothetical protein